MSYTEQWRDQVNDKLRNLPERLNPLLKLEPLQAADEAACKLDGMFRDIFNYEDRMDLIVTIIRAATTAALFPASGKDEK